MVMDIYHLKKLMIKIIWFSIGAQLTYFVTITPLGPADDSLAWLFQEMDINNH